MRSLMCWTLVLAMPALMFAQDGANATVSNSNVSNGTVYGTGSVYLDGAQLANSMPVAFGNIVETKDGSIAHIDMSGSTAMIQSNTIIRLKQGGVALDRGSISTATGRSISVFARDFEITPVSSEWTQFEVVRTGGLIHISAIKNSVEIKCGAQAPTIIREGHQLTRADAQNCGLIDKTGAGAPTAATGPILLSPWAEGIGLTAAGAVIGWTLSHGPNPISPDAP